MPWPYLPLCLVRRGEGMGGEAQARSVPRFQKGQVCPQLAVEGWRVTR